MGQPTNRVFSGIQPTGNLHLGNYLGAIKKFVALQDSHECIYCVVDLHAVTAQLVQDDLKNQTREIAAAFIASGIDPAKHIVKNAQNASVGLFAYPSLMAADILLYRATHVPVGDDQKQHLELTRDIAAKFNNDFAEKIKTFGHGDEGYFPITDPIIEGPATRVMSLRAGNNKMSKSEPSDMSRINLTDSADDIAKKIRKAKTDPEPLPDTMEGLAERPEAKNLVGIYAALSGQTSEAIVQEFAGQQFGTFKPALAELAVEKLAPINAEMRKLMDNPDHVDGILADGADRARVIAQQTMKEVREIFGFLG